MIRHHDSQRGFTLIEIAIAMAVLGLCVVSALQVFGGSMRLARNASRLSEAVVHAKALMDYKYALPRPPLGLTEGTVGNGFRWKREIRKAGAQDGIRAYESDVGLRVFLVTVEWDEPNGVKAYTIGTFRVFPNDGEDE